MTDVTWRKARDVALLRAGHKCEVQVKGCHQKAYHVHHKLRRSQGGTNDPDNLMALCSNCHQWVHEHPEQSYTNDWLRHREPGPVKKEWEK